jgi:hypothetical protein
MGPGSEARSISEKQHDWGGFLRLFDLPARQEDLLLRGGTVNDWIAFRTIECRGTRFGVKLS